LIFTGLWRPFNGQEIFFASSFSPAVADFAIVINFSSADFTLPVKVFCAAWLFLPGVEFDNNYFLKCFLSRNISKYFCYQQVKTL
jgi:hypothetical protein